MTAEIKDAARVLPLPLIERTVASYYNVEQSEIEGQSRKRHIVIARQVLIHLARRFTRRSLEDIGEQLGHRHHTTILYSAESIERRIVTDSTLAEQIKEIVARMHLNKNEGC